MTSPLRLWRQFWDDLFDRAALARASDGPGLQAAVIGMTGLLVSATKLTELLKGAVGAPPPVWLVLSHLLPWLELAGAVYVISAKGRTALRAGFGAEPPAKPTYAYRQSIRLGAKVFLVPLIALSAWELFLAWPRHGERQAVDGYLCASDGQPLKATFQVVNVYGTPFEDPRPIGDDGYFRVDLPAWSFRPARVRLGATCGELEKDIEPAEPVMRCAQGPPGQKSAALYRFNCPSVAAGGQ